MRPKAVVRGEALFLGSILLVLVGTGLTWSEASATLGAAAALAGLIAVVVVPALVLFWATRRRSDIARWLLVAWTAFSVWSVLRQVARGTTFNALGAIAIVQVVLMSVAVVLLFARDARPWFAHAPIRQTGDGGR